MKNKKLSVAMQSALLIFNHDPYLMEAVAPYINIEAHTINWKRIFKLGFGPRNKAAIEWAYILFSGQQKANCFASVSKFSPHLKIAVLEALTLRFGLRGE